MKRVLIACPLLLVAAGVAVPAAAVPTATAYTSCAKLLKDFPAGVAKSAKAANAAVHDGFAKPKVNAKIYKKWGARLDRDGDGVMCEQDAAVPEPTSAVVYIPTGILLIDVIYADQAAKGVINQEQATAITSYALTLSKSALWPSICSRWNDLGFRNAFLDTSVSPTNLVHLGLTEPVWAREMVSMVTTTFCVNRGFSYTN